jgi:hypothetical protein
VIEGLVGVEGAEKPREFVITIDGEQVYTAPIGGEQDHKVNGDDITRTRPVIDGRMSGPRICDRGSARRRLHLGRPARAGAGCVAAAPS